LIERPFAVTVLLRDLHLPLEHEAGDLATAASERLGVDAAGITIRAIVRRSLDARGRGRPRWLYSLALDLSPQTEASLLDAHPPRVEPYRAAETVEVARVRPPAGCKRPVVVGSGPAGLFATFRLVQSGLQPIVIERGLEVTERTRRWYRFLKGDAFDPESHLLFGEGGAGTYSDGKLYTRVNDPRVAEILQILVDHGAPSDILYDAKPHIGSNLLPSVVRRMRKNLADRGVAFRFSTRMSGLETDGGAIRGVRLDPGGVLEAEAVLLGLGHSARDTLRMLHEAGVSMEQKPFQLGARIEHPQHVVNRMQYGAEFCSHPGLPPADYRLVARLDGGDVFSFCMCPGGEILPATEKAGFICVNGASPLGRTGRFANSGFVVTLQPPEFGAPEALAGIELQETIESRAASAAEHPFAAPALRLIDFLSGRLSADLPETSYPLSLTAAPFEEFLPPRVNNALREGLENLCVRLPLLRHPDALIVGPESRSSCPVRLTRHPETLESPSFSGLYPMGEGAGHAGGIVSAAIDGMRCAEALAGRLGRT
jgi:uncharacterized FAD-dependent dehydrogenase